MQECDESVAHTIDLPVDDYVHRSLVNMLIRRRSKFIAQESRFIAHVNRFVAQENRFIAHVNRFIAQEKRFIAHVNRCIAHVNRIGTSLPPVVHWAGLAPVEHFAGGGYLHPVDAVG